MVTTLQFTRGVVRTMRAMDRAAKQAERQRVAQQLALNRQAHLDASARGAASYEAFVNGLTGAHRVDFKRRDWLVAATAPDPSPPSRRNDHEAEALAAADGYTPGWLARTFGGEARRRQALADEVTAARGRDDEAHAAALADAAARGAEIDTARRVVDRQPDALAAALEEHSELGFLPFAVEGLDVTFRDGRVIAVVDGLDLEDMPEEAVTLLKSGKASIKTIPVGKRLEMHRDAICSAAIRVAVEFLATLPLDEVEVLMLTDVLDRATGHIDATPVLHLRVTGQALTALNLTRTDPLALVERLGAHHEWTKRDGFRAISGAAFGLDL